MELWTNELGSQDFQGGLGTLAIKLMCNMTKLLRGTGKTCIMYSSLCVLKGLVGMLDISNNDIVETIIKTASSILDYDNSRKC